MLNAQLNGTHQLCGLDFLIGYLTAFADSSVAQLSFSIILVTTHTSCTGSCLVTINLCVVDGMRLEK